ncbi:DUF4274 domain-containing protein [Tamlana sp. 1_MG-2023]|uniref:DUF4274 domain-containing protein n=2 Tax=unclassified Tamlana TaxID=2614803 RepID=UPI0026E32F55|nr:DUF4274 domain-containing protein [Tamlana sp. 1_MG-2023]MDO6792502.1 DUF4274 domain-containing protein [Tamlana sp. 1_MG-2023]
MIIRPNKILMIKKNFIEFSFDDDIENDEETIPDFKKFQTLNSAEQYYLSDNYNWDDGTIVLDWIIDSPKCDKGTACLIFWRAEPDYYYDYTAENIEEYQADVWHLLQKIVERFKKNDFKSSKFEFIPTNEGYQTDWPIELDIWQFPTELNEGIKGKKPFSFGL